jgi:hypothetical protein
MRHPDVDEVSQPTDITEWYWTRKQLDAIARRLRVSRSGNKQDVTDRLLAHLSGEPSAPSTRRHRAGPRLAQSQITRDVPIPQGQRMDASLRAWMIDQVGPSFRFDGHMREYLRSADGATFGDLVDHWWSTRDIARPIAGQFEYNTFVRNFRGSHPGASLDDVTRAWHEYVATPVSQRRP